MAGYGFASPARRSGQALVGMKISTWRSIKSIAAIVGGLYAFGAVLALISLGWSWFTKETMPSVSWWSVLAPLGIGGIWLGCEAVLIFAGNGFSIYQPKTAARRAWGTAGLVAIVVLPILVLLLVEIARL